MGYEMYRLLSYASDATAKTPRKKTKKKPKSTDNSDSESSSDSDDQGWMKKTTKAKADLANIEKYRMLDIFWKSTLTMLVFSWFRKISSIAWTRSDRL